MFLWYKYLVVSLVFSHLGFWSENLSLIAPFPDLCLLVPSFAPELVGYSAPRDLHHRAAYSICESWFLIHQDVDRDLFVCS